VNYELIERICAGMSQHATINDIQVAFNENSRMTPDTSALSEYVMRYGFIDHVYARIMGTFHHAITDDIQIAFYENSHMIRYVRIQ